MGTRNRGELSGVAFLAAGFVLVGATLGGYYLGHVIDRALGIGPRWAIVGLLLGTIAGFYDLLLLVQRLMRAPQPTNQESSPPAADDATDDS